jgi:hypothetical protein
MSRPCSTCQHLKRAEIDRRLAGGEPVAQVAHDHGINPSSLHRHRTNCLRLGSSNAIMKAAARGSAAVALLPSKEMLGDAYLGLRARIDQIVAQAEQQGSLAVALSGLKSIRPILDSLARLAGYDQAPSTQINVALQTNVQVQVAQISDRLIRQFDHEPELRARIAQALLATESEPAMQPPAMLEARQALEDHAEKERMTAANAERAETGPQPPDQPDAIGQSAPADKPQQAAGAVS